MNVFDLAQTDTSLKKVSHKEYAGPCPGCGGSDRFHVQPDRKDGGAWMCRNCWPAESKGWADGIQYLRQFRSMSFTSAKRFISGELDTAIALVEQTHNKALERYGKAPSETWQARAAKYTEQAQERLWTPEGQTGLDYLYSRGLTRDTIAMAQLGYAVYRGVPCVVIPWYADGAYWRVNLRDIRPDRPEDQPRYRNVPGSSNAGLYLGDALKLGRPTFLVEGEIDALSIAQAAGNNVAVVATGTTTGSRTDKWVARLAQVPAVLVAYDNEPQGEKDAKYWLYVLEHNAVRYRPILYKDANAMLVADSELVQAWVQSALDYLSEQDQDISSQPVTPALSTQNSDPDLTFKCSECGLDLTDIETAAYDGNGVPYCDYDENMIACCSRGPGKPHMNYEQFREHIEQLASVFPGCTVTPVEPGCTLAQRVEQLKAEWTAAEPSEIEQAVMTRLKAYSLFMWRPCVCGCRLAWLSIGSIVCANCEPGGLWSDQARDMLKQSAQGKQAYELRPMASMKLSIPQWLIPGTEDWKKQVERNGLEEMKERRRMFFEQEGRSKQAG